MQHPRGLTRDRSLDVVLDRRNGRFEFGHRELVIQADEDPLLDLVQHLHVGELLGEEALVVGVRRAVAGHCVVADGVEFHRGVGSDDAGAELDRRAVTLPDRPQTHDEADSTGFDARLIGSGDDRGVAERRCLDRVLVREVRADQVETIERQRRIDQLDLIETCRDDAGMPFEHGIEAAVATDEVLASCVQRLGDGLLRHRHDPLQHDLQARRPVGVDLFARQERFGDHTSCVGNETNRITTGHHERIHENLGSRWSCSPSG